MTNLFILLGSVFYGEKSAFNRTKTECTTNDGRRNIYMEGNREERLISQIRLQWRYTIIEEMSTTDTFPIVLLCEIAQVSRVAYYKWLKRTVSVREEENLMNREFSASRPDEKWCTDVTEFKYGIGKKAYLSAIIDLYDGSIVAYRIGKSKIQQQRARIPDDDPSHRGSDPQHVQGRTLSRQRPDRGFLGYPESRDVLPA